MRSPVVVHRAPWVLPIVQAPIANGAVAVQAGRITAVGSFGEVARCNPDAQVIDHPDSVLMPGLVNAHTHLELSHLAHLSQQPPPATFTGWIENMLAERAKAGFSEEVAEEATRKSLADQQRDGVVVIGDISNTGFPRDLTSDFTGKLLCFKEYLGLNSSGVEASLHNLQTENNNHLCTGHAPYSTHADLLLALKKRAGKVGHIFPIHVAESLAETEMMSQGTGKMQEFLECRGFWDGSFQPTAIDNSGSVRYLHKLGILDEKTLCVHCIHVSDAEIDLLAETGGKICLCPGSNRYLAVGKAPLEKYLHKGMLPALGTDSLTSNPEISIWREMRLLAEEHPDVDPNDILKMATLGGAEVLGLADDYGSLESGKKAAIVAVSLPEPIENGLSVVEHLVHQEVAVQFVTKSTPTEN